MAVIQYPGSPDPTPSYLLKAAMDMTDQVGPEWQDDEEVLCEAPPCGDLEAFQVGCYYDEDGNVVFPDYGEGKGAGVDECREFTPFCRFLLVATEKCSTFGDKNFATSVRERALDKLLHKERKAFEAAVWGAADSIYDLDCALNKNAEIIVCESTDPDTGEPVGDPICVDVCSAISNLEHELFCCTDTPYIFVPAGAINYLKETLLIDEDGCFRTCLGSYVIPGVGFDGSDPDGECPPHGGFIYGTGPVKYLRGEVCIPGESTIEQMAQLQNEVIVHAERTWAFWFDPCCGVKGVWANFCK